MASALMPLYGVTCVLLAVGGVFKVTAPRAATESLARAGVRVPAAIVRGLGACEVALGTAAAIAPRPLTAALVAVAYAGFCVFGLRLLSIGERRDCGCFGAAGQGVGTTHLLLNAIGCATAFLAAVVHPPGLGWILEHSPLAAVTAGAGIAAAAFAVHALFTLFPSAWRSHGAR